MNNPQRTGYFSTITRCLRNQDGSATVWRYIRTDDGRYLNVPHTYGRSATPDRLAAIFDHLRSHAH